MKGQFSRWPAPSNGQVRQDKFLELLKAQFGRNLPPARTFRHFRPPKRGACLESGVRARIQRFQHPTGGSDLAENPQRVDWENGKGCAVGCTIHGEAHASFERELGVPRMLAWLEDAIFEGLPNRLAKTWPERFLSSIAPGRDLSPVGWQFLHWLLTESGLAEFDHVLTKAAVARCAETLVPLIDRRPIDVSAAEHAASAARA